MTSLVRQFAALAGLVLLAAVCRGATSPNAGYSSDPAAACQGVGGRYVGNLTCRMADGQITLLLSGADAQRAHESSQPVPAGTPKSWALAATALTFEVNGDRHDLLAGTVVTPDAQKRQQDLLVKWWNVRNRAQLLDTLHWLEFEGHRAQ